MKKAIKLLPIILACMMLFSCGKAVVTTSDTTLNATSNTYVQSTSIKTTASTKLVAPSEPPDFITNIRFDTRDDAKRFIEKNDLTDYGEKDKRNIGKMMDAFHSAGYIMFMERESEIKESNLSLRPQYENIPSAISYPVIRTEDNSFQVSICHLDKEIIESVKFSDTDDFEAEFYKQSVYNNSEFWETVEYSGSNLGIATQLYISKSSLQPQFHFLLDERHIVVIWTTKTDKEDNVEFAKTLTFEKVPLEKAE